MIFRLLEAMLHSLSLETNEILIEKTSEIDLDVQNFERSNPNECFGTQTFKLERADHQINAHTKGLNLHCRSDSTIQFHNSDISLLFRLLDQASVTIESQQHEMRTLRSKQQTFKQMITTLQEQILVEIQKGASLNNQLIAVREQIDSIKTVDIPWNILSVAVKLCRTQSDIDLLNTAENKELKGKYSL